MAQANGAHVNRWMASFVIGLLYSWATIVVAAVPMETGACVHLWRKNADLPQIERMMAQTRLTSWRDVLPWAQIERSKGVYAIPANFRPVLQQIELAAAQGIRPMLILGYGNDLYEPGGLVTTPEAREGFANYARWVAMRMRGKVRYYEIWNEWNIGFGSTSRPRVRGSVADYAELVRVAAVAIHSVDPQAIVVAGGATNMDTRWFEAFAATGVLDHIDGVSIHPYNYGKPLWAHSPDAAMDWVALIHRKLVRARGDKPVDMYVTEIGWPATRHGYDDDTVADYLVRFMQLARHSSYIRGVWWYDLIDDGDDPDNREHRFGLFGTGGVAKPAALRLSDCCR